MTASTLTANHRLILALDSGDVDEARALSERVGDVAGIHKIGLTLALAGGFCLISDLKARGIAVFLDMKLYDIPAQVSGAARVAADLGVDFLTVHARPSVLEAAVSATRGSETRIVGVTVLTSLDDVDVRSHGSAMDAADLVLHRARQVADSGAAGLVASPQEAAAVREALGPALDIITPGVRPKEGLSGDDQQRIAAPDAAIRAGATRLVVGRPISGADDPRAAAEAIARDIAVA